MTEHQPREHSVLCRICLHRRTFELDAMCSDRCRALDAQSREHADQRLARLAERERWEAAARNEVRRP